MQTAEVPPECSLRLVTGEDLFSRLRATVAAVPEDGPEEEPAFEQAARLFRKAYGSSPDR